MYNIHIFYVLIYMSMSMHTCLCVVFVMVPVYIHIIYTPNYAMASYAILQFVQIVQQIKIHAQNSICMLYIYVYIVNIYIYTYIPTHV